MESKEQSDRGRPDRGSQTNQRDPDKGQSDRMESGKPKKK
jgi:hypothetical protein